jgi:hypothetical protein
VGSVSVIIGPVVSPAHYALTGEGDHYYSIRWRQSEGNGGVAVFEEFGGSVASKPMTYAETRALAQRYFGSAMVAFDVPDGSFCKWTRTSCSH